ncbi:MAG: large-conductance mechanosensitive channel protein MscL [Pseudomonadota bacterium]|nr:large-conductance mechanosensitive channel protein MscL [Pseudomonadota bacterium]
MGMIKEFKDFAMRGNIVDLAVAVVIGTAFSKIVSALVDKIIMPIIGWLTSGQNFADMSIKTGEKIGADGVVGPAVAIGYGAFIQSIIDFIIVAFVIFLVIKAMNALKKKQAEAPAAPPELTTQEKLLIEIRDALKAR